MFVVSVVGLFVAPAAAAGVFLHATRTGSTRRIALLWAGGVGVVSFGGFLFAYSSGDVLHRLYLQQLRPVPVAASPYEGTALRVAVGSAISVLGVFLYRISRQYGLFGAD